MSQTHVTAAVSKSQFEELDDDPNVQVQSFDGMGPQSEFDVFVSYTHLSPSKQVYQDE